MCLLNFFQAAAGSGSCGPQWAAQETRVGVWGAGPDSLCSTRAPGQKGTGPSAPRMRWASCGQAKCSPQSQASQQPEYRPQSTEMPGIGVGPREEVNKLLDGATPITATLKTRHNLHNELCLHLINNVHHQEWYFFLWSRQHNFM